MTTAYSGRVSAFASGLAHSPSIGLLSSPAVSTGNADGSVTVTTDQLPILFNSAIVYGGLQNEDDSLLSFRAARQTK